MAHPGSPVSHRIDVRAEARFRVLADAVPHLVWIVRGDGVCDYANRRWCAFTGMAAEDALGHGWLDALHPEDRGRVLRAWEGAIAAGAPREVAASLLDQAGTARRMIVRVDPLPDDGRALGTATPVPADDADAPRPDPDDRRAAAEPLVGVSLQGVLDGLFAFVAVLSPDGTLEATNLGPIRAAGLRPGDVLGKPFWECSWWDADPASRPKLREAVARAAAGQAVRYDVDVRMGDDRTRTIDFQIVPIRDAAGRVTHLIPSGVDITDRQAAERALGAGEAEARRQLAELQSTYDNAPIGLAVLSLQYRWVQINERLAEINGIPAADHIGRSLRELLPDLADQGEAVLRRVIETGEPVLGVEVAGETPAQPGVARTWVESFHPIRDDAGRILGVNVVCEEVTAQRQAEAARREGEARFRTLADNIAQLAWMAGPDGGIFWYNRRWYDYTGSTFEETRDWGWRERIHPDRADRVAVGVRRSLEAGTAWEDTFPIRGGDGAYRWFLARAVPIRDEGGAILRWFGTGTDVTEQRAIEEALRQSDRRKSEFLAILSHELRNPLAAIRNAVSAARAGGSPEFLAWAIDVVERQSEQLKNLMDDLLDLTRIDQGKIRLRRRPMTLAEAVHRAVGSVRPFLDEHRHELMVAVAAEELRIEADPTRIEQILTNLLTNAVKYTPPAGRIELSAGREGGEAVIAVSDTGVGLSAEMLPRIFDMFAQVDQSFDRAQGGLGIGLSLVKSLVELHGGTITATSPGPGRGSTFTVRLPLLAPARTGSRTPSAPPPATLAQRPRSRPMRILAIDDNVDSTQGLAMLLGRFGHEVHEAHDGPSALEAARALRPEVVLLDIGLPGMDGYQVARLLRADPATRDALVVALSGYGQEEDQQRSREAGCQHHLVKPVELRTLLDILDAAARATEPGAASSGPVLEAGEASP